VLEIACDESGSEGEKLIGGVTDVFAHASVRLSVDAAAEIMREIRRRAPSRAVEYKAYMILRERHRDALVWLLGASGPLCGNAHVFLVDKTYLHDRLEAADAGPLNPIVPALESAVAHWSRNDEAVSIVHDRQPGLTAERISSLMSTGRLRALRQVDSRDDLRIQVADALAGAARKIASDELNGRGDPELTALLRPYVDPASIWVASSP
jgi:hypothetical protein